MSGPVDIGAFGPVNGMGERDPEGSFINLVVVHRQNMREVFRISKGAAEVLAAELNGIVKASAS